MTSNKIQLKKAEIPCIDLCPRPARHDKQELALLHIIVQMLDKEIDPCQTRPSESTSLPKLSKSTLGITLNNTG